MSLCKWRQCKKQQQSNLVHGEKRAAARKEREVTEFLVEFYQIVESDGTCGFKMGKWSSANLLLKNYTITWSSHTKTHTYSCTNTYCTQPDTDTKS